MTAAHNGLIYQIKFQPLHTNHVTRSTLPQLSCALSAFNIKLSSGWDLNFTFHPANSLLFAVRECKLEAISNFLIFWASPWILYAVLKIKHTQNCNWQLKVFASWNLLWKLNQTASVRRALPESRKSSDDLSTFEFACKHSHLSDCVEFGFDYRVMEFQI